MSGQISLPELLNGKGAKDLKVQLDALAGQDVTLENSAVRHVGAQAVQVLICAQRAWKAAGNSFEFAGDNDAFAKRLAALGADEHIEIAR